MSGANKNPDARAIVESSIKLGHELKLRVVAEGVASQEDWDLVCQFDCDEGQGFLSRRPMPGSEMPNWLDRWQASLGQRVLGTVSKVSRNELSALRCLLTGRGSHCDRHAVLASDRRRSAAISSCTGTRSRCRGHGAGRGGLVLTLLAVFLLLQVSAGFPQAKVTG